MTHTRLLTCSIWMLVVVATLTLFTNCSKTPEETLKNIALNAQKTCPQVIDEYTSMTSVEYTPGRKLKYTYLVKAELSDAEKQVLDEGMKNVLLAVLKKQPELEFYQANDVSFEHIFMDKNKQTVVLVNIVPNDYK